MSECQTCLGMNKTCWDCGGDPEHLERFAGAELWHTKAGECAGCGRKVKNGLSRGRGVACIFCLWAIWSGRVEDARRDDAD